MILKPINESQLKEILTEMCRRVGADYDKIDFKKEGWFRDYTWTEEEQEDFHQWLGNKLVEWKCTRKGKYRGHMQKWFALRFEGDEDEIRIDPPPGGHKAEFDAWRWERMEALPDLIIPFKRPVYLRVVETFRRFAAP